MKQKPLASIANRNPRHYTRQRNERQLTVMVAFIGSGVNLTIKLTENLDNETKTIAIPYIDFRFVLANRCSGTGMVILGTYCSEHGYASS